MLEAVVFNHSQDSEPYVSTVRAILHHACTYVDAEQLDLDITWNFLDLEGFCSVCAHKECFYISMPKFNLHSLKEELERTHRLTKLKYKFTPTYQRSSIVSL